ncbi:MAG: glycosyltransferase family 2 protein [Opitutaceae bacterium]
MKAPYSVLIPTRNEAANLRACIESAADAEEIVVVDSASTDGTADLAWELGASVVDFRWNGTLPKKKNWALENLHWRNEWILILDADERLTPELSRELAATAAAPEADGYYINRRFWFMGGWLRHCGYYPSWNLRFFRHRLGRYEQLPGGTERDSGDNEVHEHVLLRGRSGRLKGEMDHYAFPTISVWLEKHDRYSNWEARLLASREAATAAARADLAAPLARKRRLKRLARALPFRPTLRFWYHYFWRAGFLDGHRGYLFCRLMGIYEFLGMAKAAELKCRPETRR